MPQTLSQFGEFPLIDFLKKQTFRKNKDVLEGIGDDTAVVSYTNDKYLLLTTDMLIEGVHFKKSMDAFYIGHKALACSISDIAAMGGMPKYALISIGLPAGLDVAFVKKIYEGMNQLAKMFGVNIVGGDTVKGNKIIINVSLTGEVKKKNLVRRSTAKLGDNIYVTGALGRSYINGGHLTFIPRINDSQYLIKHIKPTAMIDISDGLVADLRHVAKASRLKARLDQSRIPRTKNATISHALYDGEDFELLFTASAYKDEKLMRAQTRGIAFFKIGEMIAGRGGEVDMIDTNGKIKKVLKKGYIHF